MNILYIAGFAFSGGIVSSLLGWTESQEPFNPKKFTSSVIRALIGAVGIAVSYQYSNSLAAIDLAVAFLAGIGVDAGGKRAAAAIAARLKG